MDNSPKDSPPNNQLAVITPQIVPNQPNKEKKELTHKRKHRIFKLGRLTKRQKLFLAEYPKDFNGTHAAIRAGFSPNGASVASSRLLSNINLQDALRKAEEQRLESAGVHPEKVLTEIARLGFSDTRKLYNDDGSLKAPKDWPDDIAAAISGVETQDQCDKDGKVSQTKKVRLWDKTKNLELLAKHLRLIVDTVQHQGAVLIMRPADLVKPDDAGE